jgi:hypothetical protein
MNMDEAWSKERECELIIDLLHYRGVESKYDPKTGLSSRLVLAGQIDDDWYDDHYYHEPSVFHGKRVRLEIHSPPDMADLERGRTNFMEGSGDLCGVARIKEGVEPEMHECRGEIIESEPVYIDIHLPPNAFETISSQAAKAHGHCLAMRATMTLVGVALLPIKREKTMPLKLKPRELDTSSFNGYGVRRFELLIRPKAGHNQSLHSDG